jgi:hypothetical protein
LKLEACDIELSTPIGDGPAYYWLEGDEVRSIATFV